MITVGDRCIVMQVAWTFRVGSLVL